MWRLFQQFYHQSGLLVIFQQSDEDKVLLVTGGTLYEQDPLEEGKLVPRALWRNGPIRGVLEMSFGHCWLYITSLAFLAFSISWHPTVKQNTFIWKYIWKGVQRTQSASVVLWEIFTFPACWKQLALFQLQSRLTMSCRLLFSSPFFSMYSDFFF